MLGVIEGFYGRQWSWSWRERYAGWLAEQGFEAYVYAPKGDPYLRKHWRQPWPEEMLLHLRRLSGVCQGAGIQFGIGLSPIDLDRGFGVAEREILARKLDEIAQLRPGLLCILFDDMRGDEPGLAALQCDVLGWIRQCCPASRLMFCPTYYSWDPVLRQVFGEMPEGYLEALGQGLPPDVDIFWTGNQVCSPGYQADDFVAVGAQLRRAPVLWDNYPVNDGRRISRFLHIGPIDGRPPELAGWVAGHFANPMNQPALSMLPLWMLARRHLGDRRVADALWLEGLQNLYPAPIAELLARDARRFHCDGLDAMSEEDKCILSAEYGAISHPVAAEVVDWLNEGYRFDPACLTD